MSHFATDGFALLRADYINKRPPAGGKVGSTPIISSAAGKQGDRARDAPEEEEAPRSVGVSRKKEKMDDAVVDRQEDAEPEPEEPVREGRGARKGGKRGGKGGGGAGGRRGGKRKGGKGRRAGGDAEAR